jgi:hypothetical protein
MRRGRKGVLWFFEETHHVVVRLGPTALNNGVRWNVGHEPGNYELGLITHAAASIIISMYNLYRFNGNRESGGHR